MHSVRANPRCGLLGVVLVASICAGGASAGGNYLIVSAEGYVGSAPLNSFVAAKTALGFDVSVHAVPAGTTRAEIKEHVLSLWGTPSAPDYILIIGDTSGDPSTSTTIPHWVGLGSRQAPTDLPYACMDPGDDWYPDIHIGRFSVTSIAMLDAVVRKSLFVEAGSFPDPDYVKRAALLATDDPTAQAEQLHDWIISTYLEPADFEATRVYARLGGGTSDIAAAVNRGCLFTVYFGHSGSSGWSSPGFWTSNVNQLTNAGLYGLVMGWSCNTAQYTVAECFGEAWLRKPEAGAAAYLSASSYVWWGSIEAWESSRRMERYFFQSVFEDHIWEVRPAWDQALLRILADPDFGPGHDHTRNIFEEFVLLGDPALRLPEGVGFSLHPDPPGQEICAPPADVAVYTVEVRQHMGFAEPVLLSATGLPGGAAAFFSPNQSTPPFVSTLTISGLAGAAAGDYVIKVLGEAASLTRQATVGLTLCNSVPGGVVLLSPPDGASEVERMPLLAWAPSDQAIYYDLEIAQSPAFDPLAYWASVPEASHTVGTYLDTLTTYYWRVRGTNPCGAGAFASAFSFTTQAQSDYFTELFPNASGSFDLDELTIAFVPDGSPDYYDMCVLPITGLPSNPAGGAPLTLGDDSSVAITPSQPVTLYGVAYARVYVNANGNLTFDAADNTWQESLTAHFARPRIAGLFDDLHPGNGGTVSWREFSDRLVVTYEEVPEYQASGQNTFQFELFDNGEIHVSWFGITAQDALAGLSAGGGVPGDFVEMNLSAGGPCEWADFAILPQPAGQSICTPAEAVYSIQVEPNLGFSEVVTLHAVGAPPGSVVTFSANAQPPPFSSEMTISQTGGVAPGQYVIEIIGESQSLERSAAVTLDVFTALPGQPALLDPPDNATGVPWSPTLTWTAGAQAETHDVEVAGDPGFSWVIYSASVEGTQHTLATSLAPALDYYWRVGSANACGASSVAPAFRFTTVDLPQYFTELFPGGDEAFDLAYFSLRFDPDESASRYAMCGSPSAALPTDPAGGQILTLTDDGSAAVTLSQPVPFYGVGRATIFVNANGHLTFDAADGSYNESLAAHFARPRVAALFDDLNPATGGTVSWRELADRVAITWENVPEYGTANSNTFQIEVHTSGRIRVTWLAVAVADALAGLSEGLGVPADFQEMNLSDPAGCPGDCNCDGFVNALDINPFVKALTDVAEYYAAYPLCDHMSADLNGDRVVNALDINPFVRCLTGACASGP